MPELPEVETTCKGIAPEILHTRIDTVLVRNPRLRRPVSSELHGLCTGQSIERVYRRAKYIIMQLQEGHFVIHLGMSGHLRIVDGTVPVQKHDHIDVIFTNQRILRYTDPRRFGFWDYCPDDPLTHPFLKNLGHEPLTEEFNALYLWEKCRTRRVAIKNFVMDMRIVVGIGNIYANESLFQAGIHPLRIANTLDKNECEKLCRAIKTVLQNSIAAGGTTLKDFLNPDGKPGYFRQALKVYGQHQQPCCQCTSTIDSMQMNGRSTFFCAVCQQ